MPHLARQRRRHGVVVLSAVAGFAVVVLAAVAVSATGDARTAEAARRAMEIRAHQLEAQIRRDRITFGAYADIQARHTEAEKAAFDAILTRDKAEADLVQIRNALEKRRREEQALGLGLDEIGRRIALGKAEETAARERLDAIHGEAVLLAERRGSLGVEIAALERRVAEIRADEARTQVQLESARRDLAAMEERLAAAGNRSGEPAAGATGSAPSQ